MGKWGTPVAIGAGDLLVTPFPSGGEVYPIKASLFVHTYARYVAGDDPREDAEARGRTERGGRDGARRIRIAEIVPHHIT